MGDGYRRRRRRPRGWGRSSGVYRTSNPYGGPMNVLNGGHDAPARPVTARGRIISWVVLTVTLITAFVVLVVRFA